MSASVGRTVAPLKAVDCQLVSLDGQGVLPGNRPGPGVEVCTFQMPKGLVFEWHTHEEHQLAWARNGVLVVRVEESAWVLPPTRALFIPAGVRHETLSDGAATMLSCYLRPERCPIMWTSCTPVVARPLLLELVGYLADRCLVADQRLRAEAMLSDLLDPAPATAVEVVMPTDERARRVAMAISARPSDRRTLAEWGREVGASSRTLARAFVTDTGVPFGRWRSLLRMRAAMAGLARGASISSVAFEVGYESTSAFVAAFRRETGRTPAAYFRD